MGREARVAVHGPSLLAPYVSLPSTIGGSTGYFSGTTVDGTSTWVETAIAGYTPNVIAQLTSYPVQPRTPEYINSDAVPSPSTESAPSSPGTRTAPPFSSVAATTQSSSSTSTSIVSSTSSPSTVTSSSTTSSTTIASIIVPTSVTSPPLSSGAKAGIGLGVVGGICLLACLGFAIFLCGRHQRRRATALSGSEHPPNNYPYPSLSPYVPQPQYFDHPDPQFSPFIGDSMAHVEHMSPKPQPSVSPVLSQPNELPADGGAHEMVSDGHAQAPRALSPIHGESEVSQKGK